MEVRLGVCFEMSVRRMSRNMEVILGGKSGLEFQIRKYLHQMGRVFED